MKKLMFAVLFMFVLPAHAAFLSTAITQRDNTLDVNSFDVSDLLDFPADDPIFGLMEAGADPNATTIIPLNFDLVSGTVYPVRQTPLTVVASTGGFLLSTPTGSGLLPTPYFEPVYFDQVDWHTADKFNEIGDNSLAYLFDPHPDTLIGVKGVDGYGGQAGIAFSDVSPIAAVPIPAAGGLFAGGLLGLTGIARRGKKV